MTCCSARTPTEKGNEMLEHDNTSKDISQIEINKLSQVEINKTVSKRDRNV
jgi:hypothetical protein